jgi:predicted site-specific integrase-resolvase
VTIEIEGRTYYKTLEACKRTGISRPTLFRWLKLGILKKYYKNHRGWRLFTEEDLNTIRAEARKIRVEDSFHGGRNDKSRYQ